MITLGPIEKLGTVWWFELFDLGETQVSEVEQVLVKYMSDFEDLYSRFDPESLVSTLNIKRILHNPPNEFCDLVSVAQKAYEDTEGVFNVAVGEYLVQSGYDVQYTFKSSQNLPEVHDLNSVIKISEDRIELKEDARIDFGGFGKGYLIDKLSRVLSDKLEVQEFLINGGGDIYASTHNGHGVAVNLQNPYTQKQFGSVTLTNQALASSSPALRSWNDQYGREHSHLVGSGNNKQTTYVVANSATQADIWATTLAIDQSIQIPPDIKSFIL